MKKKILLCWGYNRRSWIQFFEKLNADFEFVYLFYVFKSEETVSYTNNEKIYYSDFSSPFQLLDEIKPEKVIFMGLESIQNICINIACRQKVIPSYFMMHGAASISLEDLVKIQFKERNFIKELFLGQKISKWNFNIKFLTKTVSPLKKNFYRILKFWYQSRKGNLFSVIHENQFKERIPDKYIIFSQEDISFYIKQDNANSTDFEIVGNLELTNFFDYKHSNKLNKGNYLLYLETPLSDIEGEEEFDNTILTKEEYNNLLRNLNDLALKNDCFFYVKLHPYSYNNSYLFQHPNIKYIKETAIEPLILEAKTIFFYNTSLSIPAIFFNDCYLIKIKEFDSFQEKLIRMNAVDFIDYQDIMSSSKEIEIFPYKVKNKKEFEEKFIGENVDGQGMNRLKRILQK